MIHTSPRVNWVDYAKGWCILLVVMMHSTLGVGEALGGEGFLHFVVAWARPFRMPDFFLIAGLFLARSIDQDWRKYLDRKLVHFLYFYVLWMLIQLGVKQGGLLFKSPFAFFSELGLAFLEPYTTLWFIYILPMMFVLTKLIKSWPVSIIFSIAATAETYRRWSGWHTDWIILDEFPVRYIYFYAGYVLAPKAFQWVEWVQANRPKALAMLVVWTIFEALIVFTPASVLPSAFVPAHMLLADPHGFGAIAFLPGLSLLFGFIGVAAVLAISGLLASGDYLPPLRYAGAHSLVIYLSFFFPMAATRTLLIGAGASHIGIVSLIVTLSAVIIPLVVERLLRGTRLDFLYHRPDSFRMTLSAAAPHPISK